MLNDKEHLPAFSYYNLEGRSDVILMCEHASNHIPGAFHNLGLSQDQVNDHIGWDIGALAVAKALADKIDAPLIYSNYSRLLIDLNRILDNPGLIPSISENHQIVGNQNLNEEERNTRINAFYTPFHDAVTSLIGIQRAKNKTLKIVSVHSFTPVFLGQQRPWEIGVLYKDAKHFAQGVIENLAAQQLNVGMNEPYDIDVNEDMTIPIHGDNQQIPALLLEIRNDLIRADKGVEEWAVRLEKALKTKN